MKKVAFILILTLFISNLFLKITYGQSGGGDFENLKNIAKKNLDDLKEEFGMIYESLKSEDKWWGTKDCGLYTRNGEPYGDRERLKNLIEQIKKINTTTINSIKNDIDNNKIKPLTLNNILNELELLLYICDYTQECAYSPLGDSNFNRNIVPWRTVWWLASRLNTEYFGFHLIDPLTDGAVGRTFLTPYDRYGSFNVNQFYEESRITVVIKTIGKNIAKGYLDHLSEVLPHYKDILESYYNICFYLDEISKIAINRCTTVFNRLINQINNATTDTPENREWITNVASNTEKVYTKIFKQNRTFINTIINGFARIGITRTIWGSDIKTIYLDTAGSDKVNIVDISSNLDKFHKELNSSICNENTLKTGKTSDGKPLEKVLNDLNNILNVIVNIQTQAQEISLAVIPPIVFSDEHKGAESFEQITPERIFNEIRNFIFNLAPIIFILLLIIGAIFYILSPIKVEYLKTGSEYIKWAVIGYFVLLVISAIFMALRVIFGGP